MKQEIYANAFPSDHNVHNASHRCRWEEKDIPNKHSQSFLNVNIVPIKVDGKECNLPILFPSKEFLSHMYTWERNNFPKMFS